MEQTTRETRETAQSKQNAVDRPLIDPAKIRPGQVVEDRLGLEHIIDRVEMLTVPPYCELYGRPLVRLQWNPRILWFNPFRLVENGPEIKTISCLV